VSPRPPGRAVADDLEADVAGIDALLRGMNLAGGR